MRVGIAGATGFIGTHLIEKLVAELDCEILALSRSGRAIAHPKVKGIATDFFSLYSAEVGLAGCDVAFYLLHSMIPSNRLSQGSFEDFDFILADNFARAARKCGVRKIVYVGGIVPEHVSELSKHLRSRLEVEKVLGAYGIPLTAIRCSLVIGAQGSSFQILKKLVTRLPSMLLPSWCNTACQPIDLRDLTQVLYGALVDDRLDGRCVDLGAPELLTYRSLIQLTAEVAGLKRRFISIPAIPVSLSKLWVRVITGASKSLVYPLIESLTHPMIVRDSNRVPADIMPKYLDIRESLRVALIEEPEADKESFLRTLSAQPSGKVIEQKLVKSVQRLFLPEDMDALRVSRYYLNWLSRYFNGIINVKNSEGLIQFFLIFIKTPMLELTFSPNRSTTDRQLFYITGGFLALPHKNGRLEFRESPISQHVFAAIHDFKPALPWFVYRLTQAPAHRFVMWAFGKFLRRVNRKSMMRSERSPA